MKNTYPNILRVLDADVICVIKSSLFPTETLKQLHNHDGLELLLILDGEVSFFSENISINARRGDLILIRPYAFHLGQSRTGYKRILINIRSSAMPTFNSETLNLYEPFYRFSPNELNALHLEEPSIERMQMYASELEKNLSKTSFGYELAVLSLMRLILIEINRPVSPPRDLPTFQNTMPPLITNIFSYVEAHLAEETLSVSSTAEALHHNSTYISRRFHKTIGITLQQYIIAKKVAYAQKLIRGGSSLTDACYSSGFHCYSNFSRTFLQQTGMSPKQYQATCYSSILNN